MITAKPKLIFFDRKEILAFMDEKTAKALSRAGAFIRQRARTSMRRRKGISPPGSPPSAHAGNLKENIQFGVEPGSRAVLIGPTPYANNEGAKAQEFGGDVHIKTRTRGKAGKAVRVVHIRPHPYMGPALEKEREAGTIPSQWASSVRSG